MTKDKSGLQLKTDKSFVFTLLITKDEINQEYHHTLEHVAAEFESKGFRKGKAPLEVVKANVATDKLLSEVFSHLVTHLYQHRVEEHQLHPIIDPKVKIINPPLSLDKDWQVEITGCQLPLLTLSAKYKTETSTINQKKLDDAKKLDALFDNLLTHSQVELPDILIEADTQKHLADLVEQTQQAGITVTQYLKSKNETLEEYQKKLETKVRNEWTLNLAISQIALDEKITPTEVEVKALVEKNPQLKSNPNLVYYLLTQQKVIDFLKKL